MLAPGTRLGPYEVIASLGAGGMGEVYRAHDTKLGRDVALKLLPATMATDVEHLARFEREARLLAALNHPNIGTIYGVEEGPSTGSGQATVRALVLELVEGLTLRELLEARGRSTEGSSPSRSRSFDSRLETIENIADVARQIARALEAAHEKGIVHRDLKPANVKLTPDGVVKVLDFGLGRITQPVEPASDSTQDPTITAGQTMPGMVLGTAAYMSPEQARGLAVDKRADIWAFGCVLFELLTGRRAFGGDTISDVIARVIAVDPDWSLLDRRIPATLRRLLRRCLQKDPRRRLRDIGDALLELDEVDEGASTGSSFASRPPQDDVRVERLTDSEGMVESPAVSPDGKMVAFVAVSGGRRHIWIRLTAGGAPLQITRGSGDHDAPRWLPDSSALIYFTPPATGPSGSLWTVSALGGQARRLVPALGGTDVSHDGRWLTYFRHDGDRTALVASSLDGAETTIVGRFDLGPRYDTPRWSPDDRHIAFTRTSVLFDAALEVVDRGGGEPRTLARAGWMRGHTWLPDGSGLVYSTSAGSTMAYPPTNNLRVVGLDGSRDRQLTFGDVSYFEPDIDAGGRLLASRVRGRSDVWAFPIDGEPDANVRNAVRVTRQSGQIQTPVVSPDGRRLVYISDSGGHSNLWISDTDGSSPTQVTFERDPAVSIGVPVWSPSGDRLACVVAHTRSLSICLVDPEAGGMTHLLADAFSPCWSADGASLYFCKPGPGIWRVNLATGDATEVQPGAVAPTASSDGRFLYFARMTNAAGNIDGTTELYRAAPDDGVPEPLRKMSGSRVPLWPRLHAHADLSPDGRWLAIPLVDGATVNIWLVPTDGGPMRPVTDFAERSVFIARWVSWSPDSRYLYAAVAETDADIVLFDGLLARL